MPATTIITLAMLLEQIAQIAYDHRGEKLICIDTETAFNMPWQRFYDFGLAVINRAGKIFFKLSLVNSSIFYGRADAMQSCYYANKLPQYYVEIEDGTRIVLTSKEIKILFAAICEHFNIKKVCAYNIAFDYRACNNTLRNFFPTDTEYWDIMKMAKDVFGTMKSYHSFCEDNGFMTKHKKPRHQLKAETVYRFITKDPEFVEAHTGLRDVEIETIILAECFKRHKKMTRVWEPKRA
jgi:hypothetical protein